MQNIPMLWVSAAPSIVTCWDVSTMQKDSFFFNMHSTERANVKTVSIAFWKVRQGRFFAWGRLCISNRPRRLKYTRNLCYTDKLKSVFFHFFLNCSRYLPVSVCPTICLLVYISLCLSSCVFSYVSLSVSFFVSTPPPSTSVSRSSSTSPCAPFSFVILYWNPRWRPGRGNQTRQSNAWTSKWHACIAERAGGYGRHGVLLFNAK